MNMPSFSRASYEGQYPANQAPLGEPEATSRLRSFRQPLAGRSPAQPVQFLDSETISAEEYRNPAMRPMPYAYDHSNHYAAPGTNVQVNNNGQFYRPWREELALSFAKTIGNFLGWPFRLVGHIAEGILNAGLGIVKMMLLAVVAPTLIYTGIEMYQARAAGESSAQVAADVGKQGISLVGAVLGGVWDGIFGDETPEADQASEKQPAK